MDCGNAAVFAVIGIICLAVIIFFIVCYWKIWSKAGFNGAWSLLMLIPLVNLIAFACFAFAKWPVNARLHPADTFNWRAAPGRH